MFFPPYCGICGKEDCFLCDNCYNKLEKYKLNYCEKDKFFIYSYKDEIRRLLLRYKFNDYSYYSRIFSSSMEKNKKMCRFLKNYDIIIPVPVHIKRRIERGFNQCDLIMRQFFELIKSNKELHNLDYARNVLIKIKNTKPQSKNKLKDRVRSVVNVFEVRNKEKIINKRVLIFDDVYTTGSTTNECKRVLLNAGAMEVGILVIAKD